MSDFGKAKPCNNGCGATIYFDAHSLVGHPTSDKWLPLEYKEGRKTDTIHNCPKKKQSLNGNGNGISSTTKQQEASILEIDEITLESLTEEFQTLVKHISEYLKNASLLGR